MLLLAVAKIEMDQKIPFRLPLVRSFSLICFEEISSSFTLVVFSVVVFGLLQPFVEKR